MLVFPQIEITNENGVDTECWSLRSTSYLKEALRVCDKLMNEQMLTLPASQIFMFKYDKKPKILLIIIRAKSKLFMIVPHFLF